MIRATKVIDMTGHAAGIGIVTRTVEPIHEPVDYHALWDELHTQIETPEQFAEWVKRVPSFGCQCATWLKAYLLEHPPAGEMRRFGWELHNAVNAKLGKAEFTWDAFCELHPAMGGCEPVAAIA